MKERNMVFQVVTQDKRVFTVHTEVGNGLARVVIDEQSLEESAVDHALQQGRMLINDLIRKDGDDDKRNELPCGQGRAEGTGEAAA